MTSRTARRRAALLLSTLALAAGCGGGGAGSPGAGGPPDATVVPDFDLPDVNPASATYSTQVSPRDHVGAASAWYFGRAT
jgi:hypothetical protein